MSRLDQDDEFDAFLRRRTVLPAGPLAQDGREPPASVDDFVLKAARQAIRATPSRPLYRAPRWAFPVALAATLLLSFTILLNLGITSRQHVPIVIAPHALPAQPAAPATSAPESNVLEPRPVPAPNGQAARFAPSGQAAPVARPALSGETARGSVNAPASVAVRDPAAWLKRIDVLRSQGRNAEADEQLRRFRQAYPNYRLDAPAPAPVPPE